ncbi:MAG TPA: NnrS family protein [Dehalococcoidia bacterium]|nr:NnrS family protein [Dehalococcoidia bacterium]
MNAASSDAIPVRLATPHAEVWYRQFITVALLLAALIGFVLGTHIPAERLAGVGHPDRTLDEIQAHGQVQVLGFAGLYVMGMSLRLLPRFASARLAFPALIPVALWLMAGGLITRSLVMPWFDGTAHDAILLGSMLAVLAAGACFLVIVAATVFGEARRPDASSAAFILGALLLFAACDIALFVGIDTVDNGLRSLPYLADTAITTLELDGFLLVFIVGVGLRALPAMVGVERPERGAIMAPLALTATVSTLGVALLYLQYVDYSQTVVVIGDAALTLFGLVLLGFVWQAGVLRPAANRIRPASQPHLWLVRGAFAWLGVAAVLALYFGAKSIWHAELPSQDNFDALRHTVAVGAVTNLILGMSLMILPEFAMQRQRANAQRSLALALAALINLAALLRVIPALAGTAWSLDVRNASIATAGSLAEVALLLFAFNILRLFWRTRAAA